MILINLDIAMSVISVKVSRLMGQTSKGTGLPVSDSEQN